MDERKWNEIHLKKEAMEVCVYPERGALISSLIWEGQECLRRLPENIESHERPRCGIPVLFPYYGTPSDGVLKLKDQAYPAGLHGFLHSFPWRVQNCKTNQLILVMESDDELARCYPFAFHGKMTITLSGNGLTSTMEITNDSGAIMPCDLGMHPFFLIGDYDALILDFQAESMEDAATGVVLSCLEKGSVLAQGCFLSRCPWITVQDPIRNQKLELSLDQGYQNLMVWSGDEHGFLVLEPLSGPLDGINQKRAGLYLKPEESVTLAWSLRLSKLKPDIAAV